MTVHVYRASNIRVITNGSYPMINSELLQDKGVLVLHPKGPLEAADFDVITSKLNAYLAGHGKLHGVVIRAKSFPGWKDFGAMLAHLKFLKANIKKIEKVAIVADGALANIAPDIANHFVNAQVRHFDGVREDEAWDWINPTSGVQMNAVT
ncbi:MAG: STAS/SEC14 domain-containing protein [Woeseiaceae bacterium]|nr:STAS/SEC14 domain-containing protein [Woeseiaceae bacterium]